MSAAAIASSVNTGFKKKASKLSGTSKIGKKREHTTHTVPQYSPPVYTESNFQYVVQPPTQHPHNSYQHQQPRQRMAIPERTTARDPEPIYERFREPEDEMDDMGLLISYSDEDHPVEDLTTNEIEQILLREEIESQQNEPGGGNAPPPKLYDQRNMQQPMYDEPTMQILNDVAADESFPVLLQYVTQLSGLGRQAQARLIARMATFQSKNQVFSNLQNQNDFMKAQDDFLYAGILSTADMTTYDTNADFFTAQALMEASFNTRLLRSRNALNLLQLNTQRSESVMGSNPAQQEESKLRRKIPLLGQYL
jgi:hypothetical protein